MKTLTWQKKSPYPLYNESLPSVYQWIKGELGRISNTEQHLRLTPVWSNGSGEIRNGIANPKDNRVEFVIRPSGECWRIKDLQL